MRFVTWGILASLVGLGLLGMSCSEDTAEGGAASAHECSNDDDCDNNQVCRERECVEEGGSGGGDIGKACTQSAECAGLEVCDRWKGTCVECRVTSDCPSTTRCLNGVCFDTPACMGDLDCTSLGLVCDKAVGRCVECNSSAECVPDACLGHSCVPALVCESSLDCTEVHMICGPAIPPSWPAEVEGNACQECNTDGDCPSGSTCGEGLCNEVCIQAGRVCGTYQGASCGTCPTGVCTGSGLGCLVWQLDSSYGPIAAILVEPGWAWVLGRGVNSGSGIYKVNRATGAATVAHVIPGINDSLAGNAGELFWSQDGAQGQFTINRMPKAGGAPTVLSTHDGSRCAEMIANEQFVFCAVRDFDQNTQDGLLKVEIATGVITYFWKGSTPGHLRLTNDRIYWTDFNGAKVEYAWIGQAGRHTVADVQSTTLQVAGGFVYFTDASLQGNGQMVRTDLDGGSPTNLGAFAPFGSFDTSLYAGPQGGGLDEVALDGALVRHVLGASDGGNTLYNMAADGDGIVFGMGSSSVAEIR